MRPNFTQNNSRHHYLADIKLLGNCALVYAFCVKFTYFFNILFSQFVGVSIIRLATFGNHIGNVLFLSADEQMRGINTGANIAGMTDKQTVWNRVNKLLVRQTMSFNHFVLMFEKTVTVRGLRARPNPARFSFIDFSPKSIFPTASLELGRASSGTASGWIFIKFAGFHFETFAAKLAGLCYFCRNHFVSYTDNLIRLERLLAQPFGLFSFYHKQNAY